jgi:uncharacterized membrane protein YphA (DoxX/SURF4 family)
VRNVSLTYQKAFAAVLLVAWLSLARQVPWLIGERGLLPARAYFERLSEGGISFWRAPSLFWLGACDFALQAGTWLGAALAALALAGKWPRACFALSAPLYLSYATACDDFTAFQWDNMLVEVAVLSALLPTDRPAPIVRWAFWLLIFKLYFESGIAKWQSHLHDWQDGSAMTFYYETAPLPGPLAWYAHHLPAGWHHLESWGALVLELIVPLAIFLGWRGRLVAFAAFTGFQVINTLTANYGFFTYLSVALHILLLPDRGPQEAPVKPPRSGVERATRFALGAWVAASVAMGVVSFSRAETLQGLFAPIAQLSRPLRVANVYHLFGHIPRERLAPPVVLLDARGRWTEHDLRYKPGSVGRSPPLVAPHQPRVDFSLWFYGLGFRRGMPEYVHNLLDRLCHDRAAVQPLFEAPLPADVRAARIAFFRYHFSTAEERDRSGAIWVRERLGALAARSCS